MLDVIVVGGGPAGITAALRASELGAKVALVESSRLGGTCTNDGCVPTRVLAKAARLMREAHHFEDYGIEVGEPSLNFTRLLAKTQSVVYQVHEKKQLLQHLMDSNVAVHTQTGPAAFVDAHTIQCDNGLRLEGAKFILCTGGHARRLDLPGEEYALSHKDVWTLQALPRSLVIVGAAATGCQLATIFATFGTQVTLLERNPRILRVEDELVSRVISRSFRQQGIEIIPGISSVEGIQKVPGGVVVTYTKDGAAVPLEAEGVVLSSGWLGNVDSLNLDAAGVKHERNYVIVDQHLRSSAEHIFAAGDITGRMMLVQSAGYEARTAAENAVLGVGERSHHQIVPHGGFTDPEYGSVGMTEEQARAAGDAVVATVPYASLDRAVIDDHTVGFCKLIASRETHRILGAHIVGEQALETIQLVATGMAADMWVEQLAELELAYPTFTSIVGLAARKVVRELGVMPLAPQWLVLDRPHAEWERASLMEDEDLPAA